MKEIIAKFPHFQVLQDSDLEWIIATAQQQVYQPGQTLIEEGKAVEAIYLLLDGKVGVFISQQGSGDKELIQLGSGNMVGEMSFLDNVPASATLRVIEPSQVLSVSQRLLAQKIDRDGDFAARFYQLLSAKLSAQLRSRSALLAQTQAIAGEPLRKVLLMFAIFNDSDIDWMIAYGESQKLTPGTVLITQGKPVAAVYILLEGNLAIFLHLEGESEEKEIAKSVKGEILGEMSFVEMGNASATVKATERAWVLALPRAALMQKLDQDRSFAARFYLAIAKVLSNRDRDRLFRRGFGQIAQEQMNMLSEDIEAEDELDLELLDHTAIAGVRFDWMLRRLR